MRIFGGHDYYDTALALGRDETLVFERSSAEKARELKEAEVVLRPPPERVVRFRSPTFIRDTKHVHDGIEYAIYPRVVWFAGRRHGGMQVDRYGGVRHGLLSDLWFWDAERFAEFLSSIDAELRGPRKGSDPEGTINTASIGSFFSDPGQDKEVAWLVEHRISIAISETDRWRSAKDASWRIDCDGLKDIHFQRRIIPYEAFQMLSQWVGGVLPRKGAEVVAIKDEKTMLSKHGMDKWSFKTPPSA